MPDELTPPAGTIVPWARESDCSSRHDRTNGALLKAKEVAYANQRRLDALTGIDGGVGRIGELEKTMTEVQESAAKVSAAMETVQRKQDRQAVKLTLLVGAAATVATVVGGAILKLVLGG